MICKTGQDQRAHPRVPLVLPAFLMSGSSRFDALVTDISAGGAGLHYQSAGPYSGLIAQLDIAGFGCFDGVTVRDGGELRGIRFLQGEAERQDLLSKLICYIEDGLVSAQSRAASSQHLSLSRVNGTKQVCHVENISLQGVVLRTEDRPIVGELIRLGRMYGRVSEHLPVGINVRFLNFVSNVGEPPQLYDFGK